jgi:serine/threonine protein kinase
MTDRDKQLKKYTIDDAKRLWEGTIDESFQSELSIKPESSKTQPEYYNSLIIRDRILISKPDSPDFIGSDFELTSRLGQGGMGIVYGGRQTSLDREVAIKMIQPDSAENVGSRNKFLGEAMVTANLNHPNIVPIHDIGSTAEGFLFYTMKNIKGVSWDTVISGKNLSDNLEILLKVCDAMAFAHDKGVIHRDLKPENVMLGDYGEMLVVDWGLAARGNTTSLGIKTEQLNDDSGRAGTPKYMSPEMAGCDFDKIGIASDIYLLGGILYEIVTGLTPHAGGNVYACLYHAMINLIQETDKQGELVAIALKALSTEPEERYASVADFQQAIRLYRSHEKSIALEESAQKDMNSALETGEYELFARSMFGFHEALKLWQGNKSAYSGLNQVKYAYAECAVTNGDLDLADSLIDESEYFQQLKSEISKAQKLRSTRQKQVKNMKIVLAVGTAIIVLGSFTFSIWIGILRSRTEKALAQVNEEQERTKEAFTLVSKEKVRAEKALVQVNEEQERTKTALTLVSKEKVRAEKALVQVNEEQKRTKKALVRVLEEKQKADAERNKAEISNRKAVTAQVKRDYVMYSNVLKAVQGLILDGSKDTAKKRLLALNKKFHGWEWIRLYNLTGATEKWSLKGRFFGKIFFSGDSSLFAIMDTLNGVKIYSTDGLKLIKKVKLKKPKGSWTMAFSDDNRFLAIAVLRQRKVENNKYEREVKVLVCDLKDGMTKTFPIYDWQKYNNLNLSPIRVLSGLHIVAIRIKRNEIKLLDMKTGKITTRNADKMYNFMNKSPAKVIIQQEKSKKRTKLVSYNILNNSKKQLYSLNSLGKVYVNALHSHLIFINTHEKSVKLIDIKKRKIIKELKGIGKVKVDFSASGKFFALRYVDSKKGPVIEIYNLAGKLKSMLKDKSVSSKYLFKYPIIFSSHDRYFGVGAQIKFHAYQRHQSSAGIWRIVDGKNIWSGAWTAITPDEQLVVNLEHNKQITFQPINLAYGSESKCIAISPNQQYSVKGANQFFPRSFRRNFNGKKTAVTLNNHKTGKAICTLAFAYNKIAYGIAKIHFSLDSKKVIVTRSRIEGSSFINNKRMFQKAGADVYDTKTGKLLKSYNIANTDKLPKRDIRTQYGIFQYEMIPGLDKLCYLDKNSIKFVADNQVFLKFDHHASSFCLSPDGSLVILYHFGTVKVWSTKHKKIVASFQSPLQHKAPMAVSPDNSRLIVLDSPRATSYSQHNAGLLKVFDLRDGSEVIDFPVSSSLRDPRMSITFTEDGKNVILSGLTKADETIIW